MQQERGVGPAPSPWHDRNYLGMIAIGVLLAAVAHVLPPGPHPGLMLGSLLGLSVATGLVVRCGMRFSLAEDEDAEQLDVKGFLREMAVALAVFALYLGLTVALALTSVYANA